MRSRLPVLALAGATAFLLPSSARSVVLFQETFDDGSADDFTVASGSWSVVAQRYHCSVTGFEVSGVSTAGLAAGGAGWTDYRVDVDLLVDGSYNRIVRFRVRDSANCYAVNVRAAPYNDVWLHKVSGGVQTNLAHVTGFANSREEWCHLTIEAVGSFFSVMCNGVPLIATFDGSADPHLSGAVSLVAYSGGVVQWQDYFADNLLVTEAGPTGVEPATWGGLKAAWAGPHPR